MALSITALTVAATRTSLAGVAGVNENHGDADFRRPVDDLGGKVGEGPVAHLPAHSLVETGGSVPNPGQVFEGVPSSRIVLFVRETY